MDEFDSAIGLLERAVELYPGSWNAHDSLGEAFMRAGRTEQAIEQYRKSLELNPENDNARAAIERLERE